MPGSRCGIIEYAALLIHQRRRRATHASPFIGCQVCGERLRHAVDLMAGRHAGCQPRPREETGR
jgi:hypothetical protein